MEDWGRHKSHQAFRCCQIEISVASTVEGKPEISFERSTSVVRKKIMNMIQVYLVQLSNLIAVKYPFLQL